jgi:succinoglycan biosynthesis transport protein ExoP
MVQNIMESKRGPLELIQHYWHIVLKWKWTAIIFFFAIVSGTTLFCFLTTPIYTASGSIWIDDEANILPFEQIQALGAGNNMQSHVYLLQSRALATETIKKLKLYENPEFVGEPVDANDSNDAKDPIFGEKLIESFVKSISVVPVQGTRLVEVKFSHRNPKFAADTLNALFDGYVEMIVRKRSLNSEQAKEVLSIPIATLKAEIEDRERQINEFGLKKDILPLTTTEAPTITKLAEFNKALTDATINKINKLNFYNQVKSAPLGEIPDTPPGSQIQNLLTQYSMLNREYRNKLVTLKPEYPEMKRLKSELDAATVALQDETQNLVRIAFNDYQSALRGEQSLQKELEDLKGAAYKSNSDSLFYNNLRIEIESKKTLLENLTKRQNETDISSGLKGLEAINVWIVNKADPPLDPIFPQKRKLLLVALLIGLGGGLGLALGLEYLNGTIKTSKDVMISTGLPILGSIPSFDAEMKSKGPGSEFKKIVSMIRGGGGGKENKKQSLRRSATLGLTLRESSSLSMTEKEAPKCVIELIASHKPQSIQSESYRSIRTSLLVASPPNRKIKSIIFTSPLSGEGKSSTISNFGITLAAAQLRVVIVDTDLRKPQQHRIFSQDTGPGLTEFLSSDVNLADLVIPTPIPNLYLIKCGPIPANPIELLTSEKMGILVSYLNQNFDYILFDTPPILAVSDALAMGSMADTVILICRGGHTPVQAFKQAKQKLDAHKLICLGVILNGVSLVEQEGYYAKQYYHYSQPS